MSKKDNFIEAITISLHYYFDGGSIGIECFGKYNGEYITKGGKYGNIITIDRSLGTEKEDKGKWYLGWEREGGLLIDDREFKLMVIDGIKGRVEHTTQLLYRDIIPSLFGENGDYRDNVKINKDE